MPTANCCGGVDSKFRGWTVLVRWQSLLWSTDILNHSTKHPHKHIRCSTTTHLDRCCKLRSCLISMERSVPGAGEEEHVILGVA